MVKYLSVHFREESLRLIGVPIVTAGDLRKQREQKKQTHRRRGFCECCNTRYEDMKEVLPSMLPTNDNKFAKFSLVLAGLLWQSVGK